MRTGIMAAAVLALVAAACGGGGATVTAADSGSTIELAVGEVLEVALEDNPSTGFAWRVEELDEAVLALVAEPVHESDSDLVGAGGVTTWRLEAAQVGETTLRMVYERSWEDVPPEATFELLVRVLP